MRDGYFTAGRMKLEIDLISTGLKTVVMLIVVLSFLVLVLHLVKRFSKFGQRSDGDLLIKVLSSFHLSQKERIEVIEISGERIVLGVTPGNINFLAKLGKSSGEEKRLVGKAEEFETK